MSIERSDTEQLADAMDDGEDRREQGMIERTSERKAWS